MMQRDEKQLEVLLVAVMNRLNELKLSIGSMMQKIENEYETINWPTFLDNFALISSHLTGLSKIFAHELGPPLRNLTILPVVLSPERDENLLRLTEGRIAIFSHDLVPDYLRTKPEPVAEQRMLTHEQKANSLIAETALKQVAQYTKVVSHVYEMINKAREEWEVESSSRSNVQQTSSLADTHALVAAVGMGKGLKNNVPFSCLGPEGIGAGGPSGMAVGNVVVPGVMSIGGVGVGGIGGMPVTGPNGLMVPPTIRPQTSLSSAVSPSGVVGQIGKAPSAIKTNIKSANQIHPYVR